MKSKKLLLIGLVIIAALFLCLAYWPGLEEHFHQLTGWY